MNCYELPLQLRAEHVDQFRRLRPSVLMRLFQECCIAHTEQLGMGRKMTLDRGFLWVITSVRYVVTRWPSYDEKIVLRCYPGTTLHYFFPRHLEVIDEKGEVIIRATGIWTLIDETSRDFIDPKENGIHIEGEETGNELAPAMSIPMPPLDLSQTLHATYSLVDINGHVNNAKYMDFLCDLVEQDDLESKVIKEFSFCFKKEIQYGESIEIKWGKSANDYFACCPNFSAKIRLI